MAAFPSHWTPAPAWLFVTPSDSVKLPSYVCYVPLSSSPTGGEAVPSHSPSAPTEEGIILAVERAVHSTGATTGLQDPQARHEGSEVTQQGAGLRQA